MTNIIQLAKIEETQEAALILIVDNQIVIVGAQHDMTGLRIDWRVAEYIYIGSL